MMKMTRVCQSCSNEYGTFRPRCPACGSPAPTCKHGMTEGLCAVCTGKVRAIEQKGMKGELRSRPPKSEKERAKDGCILCFKRVKPAHRKSTVCPHCDEPVHVACLAYHRTPCMQFQLEREDALRKLGGK